MTNVWRVTAQKYALSKHSAVFAHPAITGRAIVTAARSEYNYTDTQYLLCHRFYFKNSVGMGVVL
jgi:hypothetical protein